jgi:pyridoxine 5-phosphate synthase
MKNMVKLGVNIDHVATIRQARMTYEPDPVWAAVQVQLAGAYGVTIHLREDRRHIQDRDLRILRRMVHTKLNLEMAAADEIIDIAMEVGPDQVTFVPERREEITTEGGLDVVSAAARLRDVTSRFKEAGTGVSMFIDPAVDQIEATRETGADAVELHTGAYAEAASPEERNAEYGKLVTAAAAAADAGLCVYAGHGLTYINVRPVAAIEHVEELNIGHSIVARAVFTGLERAVKEMLDILIV